jgi:hypothetical protein
MITIHFWLIEDGVEHQIVSFRDMQSNPFKVFDEINLSPEPLYPAKLDKYPMNLRQKFQEESNKLINKFSHKTVRIISQYKDVRFSVVADGKLTIDYMCEFV